MISPVSLLSFVSLLAPMACSGSSHDARPSETRSRDGAALQTPAHGLRAEYFAEHTDLALEQVEPNIDHVWQSNEPPDPIGHDHFSARWTGQLVAPAKGRYTIATESDDGVRVWIGDTLLIDDWNAHFVTRDEGQIDLEANQPVPIRVEYFQVDLDASLRLLWSSDGMSEGVIATEQLVPAAASSGLPAPKPPYVNPVIPHDCPDPGVIAATEAGKLQYALVCTGGSFPIHTSRNLVFWHDSGAELLPNGKPAWAANGERNWAPEIHAVDDRFVAYYTTVNQDDVLSIGTAWGQSVLGPYAESDGPLAQDPQGVIDPTYFQDDDGSKWLFYKIDGNASGARTPIIARQLQSDGLSFAEGSEPVEVLANDPATWEGGVIEAPWVEKHDGFYYLFYSGNVFDVDYRTGVARATNITGPYEKFGPPILADNDRWASPGHGSVVHAGDFDYFVYHAWTNLGGGNKDMNLGRQVLVDRIDWGANGWPAIHDGTPSRTPQPWPGEAP